MKKLNFKFLLLGIVFLGGLSAYYFYSQTRQLSFTRHHPLSEGLSEGDFDEVFQNHQDCFLKAKESNIKNYLMKYQGLDAIAAEKQMRKVLKGMMKDQKSFVGKSKNSYVMRDRGKIIGHFNCIDELEVTKGTVMIYNVCVKKDKRGQGYGNELMKHAFEVCPKEGKDLTLFVYKNDKKVVNWYKTLGFEIISDLEEWDESFPHFNKYLMKYKKSASASP